MKHAGIDPKQLASCRALALIELLLISSNEFISTCVVLLTRRIHLRKEGLLLPKRRLALELLFICFDSKFAFADDELLELLLLEDEELLELPPEEEDKPTTSTAAVDQAL